MRRIAAVGLLSITALALASCTRATTADDRAAIMALEKKRFEGLRSGNVDQIMECYIADDTLIVFDVVPPRQYAGAKAYRKDWADMIALTPGHIQADSTDPYFETAGTMAYGHQIVHVALTTKDGQKLEHTARLTDVYRKIDGKWLIVHEHASWPAEFPSGKADLQSKP